MASSSRRGATLALLFSSVLGALGGGVAWAQDMGGGGNSGGSYLLPDVTMGPPVAPLPSGAPTGAQGLCSFTVNAQEISPNPSDTSTLPPGNANAQLEPVDAESLARFHFQYISNTDFILNQRRGRTGSLFSFNNLLFSSQGKLPVDLIVYPAGYTGFKGDFPFDLMPRPAGCDNEFGCHFFTDDGRVPFFQVTLRGFLRVPPEWVGAPVNFGLYTDNSAGMALWQDKRSVKGSGYYNNNLAVPPRIAISRRRTEGQEAWRISNRVFFSQPGLYPVELWFYQVQGVAAMELSYKLGDLVFPNGLKKQAGRTDDQIMSSPPTVSFKELGFQPMTQEMFQQSADGNDVILFQNTRANSGDKPVPAERQARGACLQCPRSFADAPGSGVAVGCPEVPPGEAALYCNEAALCAPCGKSNSHCGRSCNTCQQDEYCEAQGDDFACVSCEKNPGGCPSLKGCTTSDDCPLTECCVGLGTGMQYCAAVAPDNTCRTVRGGALCCSASAPGVKPAPSRASAIGGAGGAAAVLLAAAAVRRRRRQRGQLAAR